MSNTSPLTLPQTDIKAGFQDEIIVLPLERILFTKTISPRIKSSSKFKTIVASVQAVGIIEPPVVAPHSKTGSHYLLLDGHLRLEVLKDLGEKEVRCLVSTDDESFTYNKHISRLPAIQEHVMILNAIERGLPEEHLAKALNVNIGNIRRKRNLLEGICEDAANQLKDKMVCASVFPILRKMKDVRQYEVAILMNDANLYTTAFARSLLLSTPKEKLVDPNISQKAKGYSEDLLASMESERQLLDREYRLITETYDTDVFNLVLAQNWLMRLVKNERIKKHLTQNHPEILTQFQKIVGMKSLIPQEAT
jgi:hypothetical protein